MHVSFTKSMVRPSNSLRKNNERVVGLAILLSTEYGESPWTRAHRLRSSGFGRCERLQSATVSIRLYYFCGMVVRAHPLFLTWGGREVENTPIATPGKCGIAPMNILGHAHETYTSFSRANGPRDRPRKNS